jgi:Arc/MetJ family transcription regulator
MRLPIRLDVELVAELDRRVRLRRRRAFIAQAIRRALGDRKRRQHLEAAVGGIPDMGHEWDDDPAAWVPEQRFADPRRVG